MVRRRVCALFWQEERAKLGVWLGAGLAQAVHDWEFWQYFRLCGAGMLPKQPPSCLNNTNRR